jgi:hypothetical protein
MNPIFRSLLLLVVVLIHFAPKADAAALPDFASDEEADAWLKKSSAFYTTMTEAVNRHGGYIFRKFVGGRGGMMRVEKSGHVIELSATLSGAERVSVLIFEMTNALQQPKHAAIDQRVMAGEITGPIHFGLLQELIEYDGLSLHRRVLEELQAGGAEIPPTMFTWVTDGAKTFADYHIPLAADYIDAQAKSGHTAHYYKWFWVQKGVPEEAAK